MKVLAVSDEEAKRYYDFYKPGSLDDYDLIISCGDLSRHYLEFLATMAHCPVMYVPGNHDEDYVRHPPEGCVCLDGRVISYRGVRILGLGGSYRYKNEGTYLYTESQMYKRVLKLLPSLLLNRGFDILVTHAPAYHLNDKPGLSHRGFDIFNWLIDRFHPAYFLHGHIHLNYGGSVPRITHKGSTAVVNAFEYVHLDMKEFTLKKETKKDRDLLN